VTRERSDTPAPRWGLLAATSLGFAVVQLDVSVVNVAIRPIGVTLGGGVSALQWVVSAYTITFAALILTAGTLGDRIGARRVYLAGFAVFIVASMACGAAPSLGVLIGARAVQGVGAAILVPCSLTLLNHAHPDARQRGRAVGLWSAGASVALSGGPLVGGLLIAAIGWRAIFFINVPIGLLGVALTLRHAADTPRSGSRAADLPGQLTAILGLALLAGSVIEGGATSFTSWPVLVGLLTALVVSGAFVLVERRRREPMLPLGLFRIPTFRDSALIGLLINVAFYGLIFLLSLFFQQAQGRSALQTGLAFAPMTAVVMVANVTAGRASSGRAARPTLTLGAALVAVACLSLLDAGPGSAYVALLVPLMAIGFGIGLIVPIITSALLGSVESSRSGLAAGTLNTARQAGSVLGVAILGSLAGSGLTHGLHVALIICAAIAVAVIVISLRLRSAPPAAPP
jgi:DHA2 family methylenomycin A resistance protein-like MFS transporter